MLDEEQPLSPKGGDRPGVASRPEVPKSPERNIGVLGLAFVAFVGIAGGPFGIESAVAAAGPFLTLLGLAILSVFWAFPQAIMTAELSTIFDVNGGYIVWVNEGLGRFAGAINAFNSCSSNFLDLPVYPVLFAGYVGNIFPELTSLELYFFKLVALIVVVIVNIYGMDCVALSSFGFTAFVTLPFVVQLCLVTPKPHVWGEVTPHFDAGLYMGTMLWNMQGWDSLGCFAGEVKDGRKTYPRGVCIAIVMIALTYGVPVAVAVSKDSNYEQWDDGSFVDVAKLTGKWLGYWMLLAASVAMLSTLNAMFATTSRALQSVANHKMLPSFLGVNHASFRTPVAAILLQAVTTAGLMVFDFDVLVVLDTFFNNISLVLEVIVFLKLKHTEPDRPRPYAVPGGLTGAWLCSIPKFLIILYAFYSVGFTISLAIGVGINVLFIGVALVWFRQDSETTRVKRVGKEPLLIHQQPTFGVELGPDHAAHNSAQF